jgi:hypothetical protein
MISPPWLLPASHRRSEMLDDGIPHAARTDVVRAGAEIRSAVASVERLFDRRFDAICEI